MCCWICSYDHKFELCMYNYLVEIVYLFMKPFFFIYMYFHAYFPWSKVVCKRIRKAGISLVGGLLKNVHGIAICPEMHALMKMKKIRQNLQWSSELISLCRIWLKFFKIASYASFASTKLTKIRPNRKIHEHSLGETKFRQIRHFRYGVYFWAKMCKCSPPYTSHPFPSLFFR